MFAVFSSVLDCITCLQRTSTSCLQTQAPESAAARILAVEPTLEVSFWRVSGALRPNDKVRATTLDSKSFQGFVERACRGWLLMLLRLASCGSASACGV